MGWFALGDGGEAGGEAVRPAMVVDCLKHVCLREVLDITCASCEAWGSTDAGEDRTLSLWPTRPWRHV